MKTLRCKRNDEALVVKVYFKQDTDNLKPIEAHLNALANLFSLKKTPNILPYKVRPLLSLYSQGI